MGAGYFNFKTRLFIAIFVEAVLRLPVMKGIVMCRCGNRVGLARARCVKTVGTETVERAICHSDSSGVESFLQKVGILRNYLIFSIFRRPANLNNLIFYQLLVA